MKRTVAAIYILMTLVFTTFAQGQDAAEVFRVWKAGTVVTAAQIAAYGERNCFHAEPISDAVFARMRGKSFPDGCTVKRDDLRYVRCLHVNQEGKVMLGELVCNKAIADEIVGILHELYNDCYPIECMRLIDDFDANDEKSMRANNTSCFCFRQVAGTKVLSAHARGMAVDFNPLYNPCVRTLKNGTTKVEPSTATPYINRNRQFKYKITVGDTLYDLMISHGYKWGGSWQSLKDYQHFEK